METPNNHSIKTYKKVNLIPLMTLPSINSLIAFVVIIQLYGEAIENQLLMSLKPVPIMLLIIKSRYFANCRK